MFDIEKEVPSLELCRKLKELGYPQDDGWYWVQEIFGYKYEWKLCLLVNSPYAVDSYKIKAPTLGEMEEVLSAKIDALRDGSDWFLRIEKWGDCWYVDLSKFAYCVCSEKGEKLPNAYAKMLIWLAENGYLNFAKKEANNA